MRVKETTGTSTRLGHTVLVIAPHPDDEVLGCGGTIARMSREGDEVHVLIVTRAYTPDWSKEFIENRKKEIRQAHKLLGVRRTHYLDYPTVKLDQIPRKELNEKITFVVKEVKPDIVFMPHKGDIHYDHRIVFEASLVALRPHVHRQSKILAYETLSETEWGHEFAVFKPNVYYDITDTFSIKMDAVRAYSSELREFPHPRSLETITALAKKRGSEVGVKYAEAFYLIREVIS